MSTSTNNTTPTPGRHDSGVQHGVDLYACALRVAGGDQVEAVIRGDAGHRVGAALYRAPPFQVNVPALKVSRLSVNLTKTRVGGAVEGERLNSFDASRYALFLTPADAPMVFRKDVPSRHINIYFHPDAFGDGDDATLPLAVAQPVFNMVVPGMRGLADQLVNELQSPVMLNADAADSLARLMLVHVARHLRRAPVVSKALSPALLARLRDYVMAHLSERILVADLAKQTGLSLDCFAVAFKAQTGQAAHQFVLVMRLEHATDLLRHSTLSVADVAHACGFASQQHLTNVMHSRLGVTPRRYRDAMPRTFSR
jgi:AraC family transcriptional regulator